MIQSSANVCLIMNCSLFKNFDSSCWLKKTVRATIELTQKSSGRCFGNEGVHSKIFGVFCQVKAVTALTQRWHGKLQICLSTYKKLWRDPYASIANCQKMVFNEIAVIENLSASFFELSITWKYCFPAYIYWLKTDI